MRRINYSLFVALGLFILFFCLYTQQSLKLYWAHETRGDLTAYAQGMWNTINGHFMASTYNYSVHNYYDKVFRIIDENNSNIFGVHFNPIILLFVPIYALWPHPETLLIIQALLTAAAGYIVYLLCRLKMKNDWSGNIIQFAFYLYLPVVSAVLSQFHAFALAIFFGMLLIFAVERKWKIGYWLALILFILIQENTPLVAVFFGLYLLLHKDTRLKGLFTILIASAYFVVVINYLIPSINPLHTYLFGSIYGSPLGNSIPEIMRNTILHPGLFITTLFTAKNYVYVRDLMLPVFPFVLISPTPLVVGLAALAQNLLSSEAGLKTHLMHYESGATPFILLSLISGYQKVAKKFPFVAAITLLTLTLVGYKSFTGMRLNPTLLRMPIYNTFDGEADSLMARIPAGSSVSTQDYLSANLAGRPGLYQFPIYMDRTDYVLITKTDQVWPLTNTEQQNYIELLRDSHQVVGENQSFILFAKK